MNRKNIVVCILVLMSLFIFTAATKAKAAKTPKPTVASLTKQLKAANDTIAEIEAKNTSITARVTALETDIKKMKKDSDTKFLITAGSGAGAVVICLIIIAGMIGAKQGSGKKKKSSAVPTVEEHFNDIEYHVMDDWHNIFYHPERINVALYDDMKNHFPGLYNDIEKWKADIQKRDNNVIDMIKALTERFKGIETTASIHLLSVPENEPFIEDNEIAIGSFICAHVKEGFASDHTLMQSYYNSVMKMFEGEFKEVKSLSNEILDLKHTIDIEIRRIKHHRKLEGDCGYLHPKN